jgi:hypothetical protein
MCSELGWAGLGNPFGGDSLLACEIYHKLGSGTTVKHLEKAGRAEKHAVTIS